MRTNHEAQRFSLMFEEHSPRVYAYVRRRTDPALSEDVVSETFLVAWRRYDDVPVDPLPWLLVVARNVLADRSRRQRRHDGRHTVVERLEEVAGRVDGPEDAVLERDRMLRALAALSEGDRELLLLVAWDGLTNDQAADVVGCSRRALDVRLSRARARLAAAMAEPAEPAGSVTAPVREIRGL